MKSRLLVVAAAGGSVLALSFGLFRPTAKAQQSSSAPTKMSAADFERLFKQNTNWGRWGNDDVLGTINLITEQKRKQAAALVKSGVPISVAHDLSMEQAADNPRPLKREVAPNFRTDTYFFQYHGTFVTHKDALCTTRSITTSITNGR